jgi:chemotaxis protein methyltransferase CheR
MSELDNGLFIRMRDLVHDASGIYFEEQKKYLFSRRVEQRVEAVGAASVRDYYQMLRYDSGGAELQYLVESLTIGETYFFREYSQLRAFADEVVPEVIGRKRQSGDTTIHLWSAGCSTGEEPCTLAIILREVIDDFDHWQIVLTATDINQISLTTAQHATYEERSVRDVPTVYLKKYFQKQGARYHLSPLITRMVKYRHANLMDRRVANELGGQDFIFCRNVMIYFDDNTNRTVLGGFYDALHPGGYVFLGHSESVGRITSSFRLVRRGEMLMYMK